MCGICPTQTGPHKSRNKIKWFPNSLSAPGLSAFIVQPPGQKLTELVAQGPIIFCCILRITEQEAETNLAADIDI